MIIKSFSIIDYKNKEAASYNFSDQINLIVSKDNTMGKSSLLKSLYYNLGFQIKQFPSKWNPTDMFFQITVFINGKKHIISRQNKLFKIDGRNEPLNEREYSDWLQEKLNTNMELPNVRTKELSNAYSSAVILPFYIDQDDSWDGIMYRRVSNALGQYHNIPQTIFEYLFGLSDIDIQKLQNDLNIELKMLREINSNIEGLNRVIDKYQKDTTKIPSIDKKKLEREINYYLSILNEYNNNVNKYKVKLINDQQILDNQEQELAELEELLKLNKKRTRDIELTCNYCHSNLTDEQSLTRFNLSNNEFEIEYLRDEVFKNISKIKTEIEKTEIEKQNLMHKIDEITNNINKSKELLTIDEYVDAKAKSLAVGEMNDFILNEKRNKDTTEEKINNLRKKIKKLKKDKSELKQTISTAYGNELNNIKTVLHDIDIEELNFLSFKTVKGSGMDKNKKYLAYYLIYMFLIDNYGMYKIPFCMDSFIKNEITTESAKQMFVAIEQYLFKSNNQVFFSLVEQNKKHLENLNEYNIINVGPKLLSKKKYDEVTSNIIK